MDTTEVCNILRGHLDALPPKSKRYASYLSRGAQAVEKQSKVIAGIIHECLESFKKDQHEALFEVIVTCGEFWIENWDVFSPPPSFRLDVVIYEVLKAINMSPEKCCKVKALADIMLKLAGLPDGCTGSTSEWFFVRLYRCDESDWVCGCRETTTCLRLNLFHLKVQGIKVCFLSGRFTQAEAAQKLAVALHRELWQVKIHITHGEQLAKECNWLLGDLLEDDRKSKVFGVISEYLRHVVLLHVEMDGLFFERITNVCKALKTMSKKKGHIVQLKKLTSLLNQTFALFMSNLGRRQYNMPEHFKTAIECIDMHLTLVDRMSMPLIAQTFAFYNYVTEDAIQQKHLSLILSRCDELLSEPSDKSDEDLMCTIAEEVLHICSKASGCTDSIPGVLSVCQKLLLASFSGNISSTSSTPKTGIYLKASSLIAKMLRRAGRDCEALDAIEKAMSKLPLSAAKGLVKEWVGAKVSAMQEIDMNPVRNRTLADGLIQHVPVAFIKELLWEELRLYKCSTNQLAAINALLEHCELSRLERSNLACKRLRLHFEYGEHEDLQKHLNAALNAVSIESETWENYIQVKLIEFLYSWNTHMEGERQNNACGISVQSLNDIVNCCNVAALKKFALLHEKTTCEIVRQAAAILSLFQENECSTQLLISLISLLSCSVITENSSTKQRRLWNISFAHSKIAMNSIAIGDVAEASSRAELAAEMSEKYASYCGNDEKSFKVVHLMSQTALAHVKLLTAEYDSANSILATCLKDDFLNLENMNRSNLSGLASVRLMYANAELLARTSEPAIYTLLEEKRRVLRLNRLATPMLPQVGVTELNMASPVFGVKNEPGFVDTETRVNLIVESLRLHSRLAEAFIYSGDCRAARVCIVYGLLLAGRIRLKKWYILFFLLKLKLTSLEGWEEQFQLGCQSFTNLIGCTCGDKSQLCMKFDLKALLRLPKRDEDSAEEINAHLLKTNQKIGSAEEDDAIDVMSQPIDPEANDIVTSPTASPILGRRVQQKSYRLSKSFQHVRDCHCSTCSDDFLVQTQTDYANLVAEHCSRAGYIKEGIKVCDAVSKLLKTKALTKKKVCTSSYMVQSASNLLAQADLLMDGDMKKALKLAKEVQNLLATNGTTNTNLFRLNARANLILHEPSPSTGDKEASKHMRRLLDRLIDAVSNCHMKNQSAKISTPVTHRSTKATSKSTDVDVLASSLSNTRIDDQTSLSISSPAMQKSALNRKKTLQKSTATLKNADVFLPVPSSRRQRTKSRKPFLILSDDSDGEGNGNKGLPKPKINTDNKNTRKNDVYHFSGDEDEQKKGSNASKPNVQNLMEARKMATRRHRHKFALVDTNEVQERVRGLKARGTSSIGHQKKNSAYTSAYKDNVAVFTEAQYARLRESMLYSNLGGDTNLTRHCAAALCLAQLQPSGDIVKAAACHLFSIGVSIRTGIHVYAKTNLRIQEQNLKETSNQMIHYKNWLDTMASSVNPHRSLAQCLDESAQYIEEMKENLDKNWTVCALSLSSMKGSPQMLATRIRKETAPFCVRLDGTSMTEILHNFQDLMHRNSKALKCRDRRLWWTHRRIFGDELYALTKSMGDKALGCHAGVLLGKLVDENKRLELTENVYSIIEEFDLATSTAEEVDIILNAWHCLSPENKLGNLVHLCGVGVSLERLSSIVERIERVSADLKLANLPRHHVVLILDKDIQLLPWESIPILGAQSMTRMPSCDILKMQLSLLRCAEKCVAVNGVDMNDVSYVINPNGDLPKTEERYKGWFQQMGSWRGIISRPPSQEEWISGITTSDLFIYCGHGSGAKFAPRDAFRKIKTRAAVLLMGCGSGKLDQDGIFEPSGVILDYLITGAPCVLGCLWQVTDKDIDKYAGVLLSRWCACDKSLPACAKVAQFSCKMPWLNGAACVYYGLPVHCQRAITDFLENIPEMFIVK